MGKKRATLKRHAAHAASRRTAAETVGTKRKHPLRTGLITLFVVLAVVAGVSGVGGASGSQSAGGTTDSPAAATSAAAESQRADAGGDVAATDEGAIPSASSLSGDDFLALVDSYATESPAADAGDYVELNGNVPSFGAEDATTEPFQSYAELDALGRCGTARACLGPETLPTQERGDISEVHPSGWQSVSYDFVDGGSLYNRSHLIAFCLSGQNANECNLVTGTRHMNADVMAPIEEMVLGYIEQAGNHVLYRVTPVFAGEELVARGLQIEALSMEDGGQGVSLNLYLRNTQPGVAIDYATGDSWADGSLDVPAAQPAETVASAPAATEAEAAPQEPVAEQPGDVEPVSVEPLATEPISVEPITTEPLTNSYVVNTNTGKFHYPGCSSADQIKPENRWDVETTRDDLIAQGYVPCKRCNP